MNSIPVYIAIMNIYKKKKPREATPLTPHLEKFYSKWISTVTAAPVYLKEAFFAGYSAGYQEALDQVRSIANLKDKAGTKQHEKE